MHNIIGIVLFCVKYLSYGYFIALKTLSENEIIPIIKKNNENVNGNYK